MSVSESTLRAHIAVALKGSSKATREAFNSRSWQEREVAERTIAETVMGALKAFDIENRPMPTAPAPSMDPYYRGRTIPVYREGRPGPEIHDDRSTDKAGE